MAGKEKNFVSAVVYLGNEAGYAGDFLEVLTERLATRFENYELVFVEDGSSDGTEQETREFLARMPELPPVTMIHMSLRQGLETAMNAGLDMAIGDFVYEFDSMRLSYPENMIDLAYDACLEGNDIVSVSPQKNRGLSSALFYRMFNSASGSQHKLRTEAFRLLSRRAINRVHSISDTLPYRKAAYAASGLKMQTLTFKGKGAKSSETLRMARAVDSLALYTTMGYRLSLGVAVFMLMLMLGSLVYTVAVYFIKGPAEIAAGWLTTMLLLTGGFFGVFAILAIILKYLSLLVELVFKKQKYLISSVEKIT